jgi:TRAP-type C4-dicarboxylate transport system substrate-binding protein
MGGRAVLQVAAAALVMATAACGGSGGDKAGGADDGRRVVLMLESEDDVQLTGAPEFAQAVARLSRGSMRIGFVAAGRNAEIEFERGVVEDVRKGKAQLGIVGARVWDTMSVTSFQALLAPFLVDSFELLQRVLESALAGAMLRGVEDAGVVGVALLPGPLRRPVGITRALVRPDDYRGATVSARPAGVARAALRALGANPKSYVPGPVAGADGDEGDPTTVAYSNFDRRALTANVVLWPKPYTIVMNREAFATLTDEQQEILRRAGREAIAPELRQVERDEAAAVAELCTRLSFPTASRSDLHALRVAVHPVYAELERDPQTKEQLAEIEEMKRGTPATVLATTGCVGGKSTPKADSSALDGTWQTTWTRAGLIAEGLSPKDAEALSGRHFAEFRHGRFRFHGERGSAEGTYSVDGDVIRLVFETGIALQLGRTYELEWNVYRDSLTFSAVPGSEALLAFLTAPYRRVR